MPAVEEPGRAHCRASSSCSLEALAAWCQDFSGADLGAVLGQAQVIAVQKQLAGGAGHSEYVV